MTNRTELIIRLRECADGTLRLVDRNVLVEAADAIAALVAERDRARADAEAWRNIAQSEIAARIKRAAKIDALLAEKEGTT